ncbi:MAG: D-Ala-D-Ala carboxypeptidase family metallohydrolase [Bacteroidetes bacterium]|nr:D-Ala-D-Ala carboxypeptidase family metallohydrolase [Bacteroidota bacterium]
MKITLDTTDKSKSDSSPDKSRFGMTNSYAIQITTDTSLKLSASFCLKEFAISQVAERNGYKNEPNEKQIENLKLLCVNVLQPLREIIAVPIFINSGFRSFDVNTAVGGKFNSQHLEGKAADFVVPSMNLVDVFNIVLQSLTFDQLIYEFGRWIHVSWNGDMNRNEVLLSKKLYGKTIYEKISGELQSIS